MGLNVQRVPPHEWLLWAFAEDDRHEFLKHLGELTNIAVNDDLWTGVPGVPMREFPEPYASQRVGSYTAYGIFVLLLEEVDSGVDEGYLDDDEDLEREALTAFRNEYGQLRVRIPGAQQFVDASDCDSAYVPVSFDEPFMLRDRSIASLHEAIRALEAFAEAVSFDLRAPFEEEYDDNDNWIPLGTMRNVARILYQFFEYDKKKVVIYT